MMRAVWNGAVLAESEHTVRVEGNHYFPPETLNRQYFRDSSRTSRCAWKGTARYYTIVVDGAVNHDAAWYYPDPTESARQIKDRVAFWAGVRIEETGKASGRRSWFARLRGVKPTRLG